MQEMVHGSRGMSIKSSFIVCHDRVRSFKLKRGQTLVATMACLFLMQVREAM